MLSDGLGHAAGAGNVDEPHLFFIGYAGAQRIEHKGQVRDRLWAMRAHKLQQLVAGALFRKVDFFKAAQRCGVFRFANVSANHVEVRQLLEQTKPQIA
jgi:uncharacterized membrane protein (DUF2068 family)